MLDYGVSPEKIKISGMPVNPKFREVDEKDAQAVALAYVHDTTKVDKKKFAKHSNDQKCNNCALYQGKAADAWGGCPLFGTKQVAGPGWCSAWAKKG